MNKIRKILKFLLTICLIITIYSMIVINFSSGEDKKMNRKINLISEYSLDDVDKIIIETTKDSPNSYQHIVIEDQKTIKFMVAELKNIINAGGGIGMICDYNVSFWRGNNNLLVLGFQITLKYPEASFMRYSMDRFFGDYRISRAYHDFFVSILHLE